MSTKEQYWKYSLITIIIGLGIILARQITPFLGGLLGALTIYILVRRQMIYVCTGICPLLHADRRKENGAICQRTSSFQ